MSRGKEPQDVYPRADTPGGIEDEETEWNDPPSIADETGDVDERKDPRDDDERHDPMGDQLVVMGSVIAVMSIPVAAFLAGGLFVDNTEPPMFLIPIGMLMFGAGIVSHYGTNYEEDDTVENDD